MQQVCRIFSSEISNIVTIKIHLSIVSETSVITWVSMCINELPTIARKATMWMKAVTSETIEDMNWFKRYVFSLVFGNCPVPISAGISAVYDRSFLCFIQPPKHIPQIRPRPLPSILRPIH
jgi:hypothetical protein